MKIKINTKLQDEEGKEIIYGTKPPLTLRDVIVGSLLGTVIENVNGQLQQSVESEEIKWQKYEIFKKIKDEKHEVELKIEEIALIKKYIGKIQPTIIMGQSFELLEGVKEEKPTNNKPKKNEKVIHDIIAK